MAPNEDTAKVSFWTKIKKFFSLKSDLKQGAKFSRLKMVVFAVAFGLIGLFIFRSYAATPLIATLEAEQMSLPSPGGSVVTSPASSGGKAVWMLNNGTATGLVNFPSSVTSLTVVAKGSQCSGAPIMTVALDGTTVISRSVTATGWTSYTANTKTTAAGNHTFSIKYSNDYKYTYRSYTHSKNTKSCDRNLYLDVSRFYGPVPVSTPAPTISFSATPTTLTVGGSSTLTWSSTNASSCTASNAWSGAKATSGSVSTGALNQNSTYALSCSGTGGTATATANVTVTPVVATPPPSSGTPTGLLYGYQLHIPNQKDQANYVSLAASGGAKTIRDDFEWTSIEPSNNNWQWGSTDNIVSQTAKNGLSVLAMVGYAPAWATGCTDTDKCGPLNNADYADVASHVAQRYGHNGTYWAANPSIPYHPLVGIEVWNEPNLGFWRNPNPVKYTAMLKAAYPAIKAADPNMIVISGGLAPQGGYNDYDCNGTNDGGTSAGAINQVNFLQAMYQNGAAGYMDAVGYHPYNWGGTTAAHYFNYDLCSGWSQMADTPVSIHSLMVQNGDGNKKIWGTELGSPTGTHLSDAEQASLATQLVAKWKTFSYAGNFYWYDLRDDCADNSNAECRFGTVRQDSSLKPSYTALKTAWQ